MSPGVYRLEHGPSGRFYIGCSMSLDARRAAWRRVLLSVSECARPGDWVEHGVSERFGAAVIGTSAADWDFVIVERHPEGVARGKLLRAELAHVARSVRDFPDLCLNSWAPGRYDRRKPRFEGRRALKRPGV